MEDTLLVFRIPSFQPRSKLVRRVSQRDKMLLFDVGVRNALLSVHNRPVSPDQYGSLFERWLTLQVIDLNRALQEGWQVSSYRTRGGAEVHRVIERADDVIGLEIKASRNVGRSDLRGPASLADALQRYKPLRRRIAYPGPTRQRLDGGVEVLPYQNLLELLRDDD